MESYRNYGFLLEDASNLTQKHYDDIKGSICQICASVEYAFLNKKEIPNFTITFPLGVKREEIGVIHVLDRVPYFYIYDGTTLSTSGKSTSFSPFIDSSHGEIIAKRCYNHTKLFLSHAVNQSQIAENSVLDLIKTREQTLESIKKSLQNPKEIHSYAQTYFNDEPYSIAIASNPNTHLSTLYALAHSPFINVKIAVAKNPNTDFRILDLLLKTPEAVPYIMEHPNYLNEPPKLTI